MMQSKHLLSLLKASSFLVFIGRAYQHLFWDAPFRVLLWDEQLLKPIINFFGKDWSWFVSSLQVDYSIQIAIKTQGLIYLIAAIVSLIIKPDSKRWMRIVLFFGGFALIILAFLLYKDRGYQLAQFFEHSIQFGVIFGLIYYIKHKKTKKLLVYLKILIALSFTSHGIYALGMYYPIPANFIKMTMTLFPFPESEVINLLFLMGTIDLVITIFIFIPKIGKWALFYAFIWGTLTAMARFATGLAYDISLVSVHQYLFESIYRLAQGLVPLAVFFSWKK